MNLPALLHEAWLSVGSHRLRTFLAVLGIVIGVASVVLMLAIGAGSRRAIEESIEKLGTNLLIVSPGNFKNRSMIAIDPFNLQPQYADAMAQLPGVLAAAAATNASDIQIVAGGRNWNARVSGVTPPYFPVRNWTFTEGNAFLDSDMKLSKQVAVIGATAASNLFPNESAYGQTIRLKGASFLIVGVLAAKGQDFGGRDQDNMVFIPLTTARKKLFGKDDFFSGMIQSIFVQAISKDTVHQATEEVTALLRRYHRLKPSEDDDFTIRDMASITQIASETTQAMSLLLGAVASISLVVGGIGIANIMLVNVTERTREIGIRKAIGASRRQILLQFLLEAVLITASGSVAGLAAGFGGGWAVDALLGVQVAYTLWPVILSITVAIGVGVLAGLYPALKAARLEPIEALRTVGA